VAIVTLHESQARQIEAIGADGQWTGALVHNANLFFAAMQVGVSLARFLSWAYRTSSIAPEFVSVPESWGLQAGAASAVAVIGMTHLIAFLPLGFGELVPQRPARQHPIAFTRVLERGLSMSVGIMRPVIWLLFVSTEGVLRLLGRDPNLDAEAVEFSLQGRGF